jgi:hypothetical protein
MGKHCIECKRKYPLWMYKTDIRKYTIPEAQKKVRKCRICTFNESGMGKVVRWNGTDFELRELSLWDRVKELISK